MKTNMHNDFCKINEEGFILYRFNDYLLEHYICYYGLPAVEEKHLLFRQKKNKMWLLNYIFNDNILSLAGGSGQCDVDEDLIKKYQWYEMNGK